MELIISPKNRNAISVPLYDEIPAFRYEYINSCVKVYSDLEYDFALSDIEEEYISISYFTNEDRALNAYTSSNAFSESIGFAYVKVRAELPNHKYLWFYSSYLSVMIKHNQYAIALQNMAYYVYKNEEILLHLDKPTNVISYGSELSHGTDDKSLDTQIKLLEHASNVYSDVYSYLLDNAHFTMTYEEKIDSSDRLRVINFDTIRYILTHPEYLYNVPHSTGIQFRGNNYYPEKTLILSEKKSYNVYENRIILSFLYYLCKECDRIINRISDKLKNIAGNHEEGDYISSSGFLFYYLEMDFQRKVDEISVIRNKLNRLFVIYSDFLNVRPISINSIPAPSPIFENVPQYQMIYECMKEWFLYGQYNLEKEALMIQFVTSGRIYEYYVLIEILNEIKNVGFKMTRGDRFEYPVHELRMFNSKIECDNTFFFDYEYSDLRITLYYQPVIYSIYNENGIELYRNTSWSFNEDSGRVSTYSNGRNVYYTPDYLIKVSRSDKSIYWIIDAKYKSANNVLAFDLIPQSFKYLFSLSANNGSKIAGLSLIYGKSNGREEIEPQNIHDLDAADNNTIPFMNMIYLSDIEHDSGFEDHPPYIRIILQQLIESI